MVLLNRIGPAVAAASAGVSFLIVFSTPQAVYIVIVALLGLLFAVAAYLPAQGWPERFQRWLALSLPVLAGGWSWLFLQQSAWRLALPLAVALLVLVTGESLFRAAYGTVSPQVRWLTVHNVLTAWLFFNGLAAASLLLLWPTIVLPVVAALFATLLLMQGYWAIGVRFGPWWNLSTAALAFAQLSWVVLKLPMVYPVQGALLTLLYGGCLWLYLRKASGVVSRGQAAGAGTLVVMAIVAIVAIWTL